MCQRSINEILAALASTGAVSLNEAEAQQVSSYIEFLQEAAFPGAV
jgi:hypothetical protein